MLFRDVNKIARAGALLSITGVLLMGCASLDGPGKSTQKHARLIDYVDPFIGTDGKGKTYPGATVPYGMVQLSPDNGRYGWDWISGYFYPDDVIAGFSHTHLSGTGAGDLYDISFMPLTEPHVAKQLDEQNPDKTVVSHISHDNEQASPGYYQVYLQDYKINVELTAAERTGIQRYTFASEQGQVKLDLGYARNWDKTVATQIEIVDSQTIRGVRKSTGWAEDQRTYFYTRFSQPFTEFSIRRDGELLNENNVTGVDIEALFSFDTNQELVLATAISSVSTDNAQLNLQADIGKRAPSGKTFEQVKRLAQKKWEQELSKVEVVAEHHNMVQFYTALYHSALAPRLFSDVNGEYKGPDGNIHSAKESPRYEFFSLWDTFRAQHPWKTITHPTRSTQMMDSIIAHYREYGLLPVWNFQGNETDMMMGYHAVPVLADTWLKGLIDTPADDLLKMMRKSANQSNFGIDEYNELGFVPFEAISWNVSRTLEYAFDDHAIARIADKAGNQKMAAEFYQRAQRYKTHFDPEYGLMRAKSRSGEFKQHFDPLAYHPEDYCEANAWQYSFFVPHDVQGLIDLYPSNQAFIQQLDAMFSTEQADDELPEWISGFIGQYVHGNEPAHHVPYLYRLAGAPHKGEKILRQVMDELYTTKPDGLCGNEDAGQMSAWYMFSAIGFYPVNPVGGEYVFGSPEVEQATFNLENGNRFVIQVENQSPENVYVKEIWLNGERVSGNIITHETINAGGNLRFVMSATPTKGIH